MTKIQYPRNDQAPRTKGGRVAPSALGPEPWSFLGHWRALVIGHFFTGLQCDKVISAYPVTRFGSPSIQRSLALAQLPSGFWRLASALVRSTFQSCFLPAASVNSVRPITSKVLAMVW